MIGVTRYCRNIQVDPTLTEGEFSPVAIIIQEVDPHIVPSSTSTLAPSTVRRPRKGRQAIINYIASPSKCQGIYNRKPSKRTIVRGLGFGLALFLHNLSIDGDYSEGAMAFVRKPGINKKIEEIDAARQFEKFHPDIFFHA
ncbi:hypothetical protein BJ165DRAFT_1410875 [Panaeolus papilionaceus]|nr:hypothetical protein BJ165DRAFT_1410875 [Panaeolus papilionaceus]